MRSSPAVSIVMAVYNVEPYIGAAIESARAQTFSDFELIIVDDGSTDGTLDAASRYSDSRIRLIASAHRGAPWPLYEGIALARAPYLSFLDGDDLWSPLKLERHVQFLDDHLEADLTFSWSRIVDQNGCDTGLTSRLWKGPISFGELLADNVIGNGSALMFRREALLVAGGIDTALAICYDLDAWLRIALLRPRNLWAIPEFLTLYRRRPGQLTANVPLAERYFERLIQKMRVLEPGAVADSEERARSNMQRFFAYGWYQAEDYPKALSSMARSFGRAPGEFLADWRNWKMTAAAMAGLLLPHRFHDYLTRAALKTKRA